APQRRTLPCLSRLRVRPPPSAPLLPYTTLFRSLLLTAAFSPIPEGRFVTAYVGGVLGTLIGADLLNLPRISDLGAPVASIGGAGDRKSTRLNSSHVKISYAVFCLKKKTRSHPKN